MRAGAQKKIITDIEIVAVVSIILRSQAETLECTASITAQIWNAADSKLRANSEYVKQLCKDLGPQ
jgi:hypothetical protein